MAFVLTNEELRVILQSTEGIGIAASRLKQQMLTNQRQNVPKMENSEK